MAGSVGSGLVFLGLFGIHATFVTCYASHTEFMTAPTRALINVLLIKYNAASITMAVLSPHTKYIFRVS